MLYLDLEEGSPLFKQINPFYFKVLNLFSFTLLIESRLISFPEANKILQFTSFKTEFLPRVQVILLFFNIINSPNYFQITL